MICFKHILFCLCILCVEFVNAQQNHFGGGYEYSVFICNNQSLYTWGDNNVGQLARTQNVCNYKLPCIAPIPYNIKSIDPGFGQHCLAVTSLKNVISWGTNYYGELGINQFCPSYCYTNTPNKVLGGETGTPFLENIISVATGQSHSYALLNTGEVVAWGNNSFGQLGNGTTTSESKPVYVKKSNGDRLQNIIMISAGANHGYALTADGHVYAWGNNQSNQLGCGNSNNQVYPQLIVDKNFNTVSGIVSIDGGKNFGLLLRNSTMVMGVGAYKGTNENESGEIYVTYSYAELVTGGQTSNYYLENVVAISAGYNHSIAIIKENNKNYAVAWGDNRFENLQESKGGQIGTGIITTKQYFSPQYMLRSSSLKVSDVTAISAGCGVSYLQVYNQITKQNQFWVCGANSAGQLGTNDFVDRLYATQITSNVCQPYCSNISYSETIEYCSPFEEVIQTNINDSDYTFSWKKDGTILPNVSDSLIIFSGGLYQVEITHINNECPKQNIEIQINEKLRNFKPIYSSYCGTDITFKVIGEGTFIWSKTKNGTALFTGNTYTVPITSTQEIIADSIYQLWLTQKDECQPIPITSVKKCNCSISPPTLFDTVSCYNRQYFLRGEGDSIIWYSDNAGTNPLELNSIYFPTALSEGIHTFYASQIINRCESSTAPITLELIYCEPWYTISGKVFTQKPTTASFTKVLLYDSETLTFIDSCYTNILGEFTLFTHGNTGKILAVSPNNFYIDTWAGNDENIDDAYEFIFDATIKGIEINLLKKITSLDKIKNDIASKNIVNAQLYSTSGKLIENFDADKINLLTLQYTKGLYILKLNYKNQKSVSYVWFNK